MSSPLRVQPPPDWNPSPSTNDWPGANAADMNADKSSTGRLAGVRNPQALRQMIEQLPDRAAAGTLIKDLSQSGVGLLYHEQLFPGEEIELELSQHVVRATVSRCRFLGPSCYEIGARVEGLQYLS